MASEQLTITINGKEYVSKEAQKAGKGVEDLEKKAKTLGETTKKMKTGLLAAVAAIIAIQQVLTKATQAYGKQEDAELKLAAALKATRGQVGLSQYQMESFATELSRMTGVADEAIIGAEGLMTTFTKVGGQVFPDAMKAAADMSAMFGQDLQQSVIQLGTALNDPIAGVGRLKRIGVSFTQDQQDMIKGFVESNDIMSAQKVILDELGAEFGGVAEQMGGGWNQSVQRMKNAFGDLTEIGGKAISEFLRPGVEWLTKMAESAYDARVQADALAKYWKEGAQTQKDVEAAYGATRARIEELTARLWEMKAARDAGERTRGNTAGHVREQEREIEAIQGEIEALQQWVDALEEVEAAKNAVTAAEMAAEELRQQVYETIAAIMDENLTAEDRERQAIQQRIELLAKYRASLQQGTEEYKKIQAIINDLVKKRNAIGQSETEEVGKLSQIEQLMKSATDEAIKRQDALTDIARIDEMIAEAMATSDQEWLDRLIAVRQELEQIAGIKSEAVDAGSSGTESSPALEASDLYSAMTSQMEGFSAEIANAVTQYGEMGLVIVAVKEAMAGFLAEAGPLIEDVIEPISLYLREIGAFLGEMIAPVLEALAPIMETLFEAFGYLQKSLLIALMPAIQIVAEVLTMLSPVIEAVGVVVGYLGEGLLWIYNNVIRHVGNGIMTVFNLIYDAVVAVANGFIAIYNAIAIKDKAYLTYRSLDAGWADEISADALATMGETAAETSYDNAYGTSYGGSYGGGTTVQKPGDIYLTLNFNSAVVGSGGMDEVGEFCVEAIQDYIGSGGEVIWLN